MTPSDCAAFLRDGYHLVPGALAPDHLATLRAAFDRVYHPARRGKVGQDILLQHQEFIDLIAHPPLLACMRALFGRQTQLLSLDLLYQPAADGAPRPGNGSSWHRDFEYPGDVPIAANAILYLDDMDDERGPTVVLPGSQRGWETPGRACWDHPLPGQVALHARAGDMALINAAIWHSGGRNRCPTGERRAIYAYYGFFWLKRYETHIELPWQARAGASAERLELLGLKMPDWDLHQFDPATIPRHPAASAPASASG